jgi:hypothetical protein
LLVIKRLCASIDAEAGRTPFLKKKIPANYHYSWLSSTKTINEKTDIL